MRTDSHRVLRALLPRVYLCPSLRFCFGREARRVQALYYCVADRARPFCNPCRLVPPSAATPARGRRRIDIYERSLTYAAAVFFLVGFLLPRPSRTDVSAFRRRIHNGRLFMTILGYVGTPHRAAAC